MKGKLIKVSPPFFHTCMDEMERGVFVTFWVEPKGKKGLKQFFVHEEIASSLIFSKDFSTLLLASKGCSIEFCAHKSSAVSGLGAEAYDIKNLDYPELTATDEMQRFEEE